MIGTSTLYNILWQPSISTFNNDINYLLRRGSITVIASPLNRPNVLLAQLTRR